MSVNYKIVQKSNSNVAEKELNKLAAEGWRIIFFGASLTTRIRGDCFWTLERKSIDEGYRAPQSPPGTG